MADDLKERLKAIRETGTVAPSEEPAGPGIRVAKFVDIPVDRLHPDEMNPNEQTPETFNALTKEIEEDEFDEPLQVCPCSCEKIDGDHYVISGGEHRWKVARYHGMATVPCAIKQWDDETRRMKMTARNLRTGDLNSRKFTELVE